VVGGVMCWGRAVQSHIITKGETSGKEGENWNEDLKKLDGVSVLRGSPFIIRKQCFQGCTI